MSEAIESAKTTVHSAGRIEASQESMLGKPLSAWRSSMQEELGLPTGFVVGTGHQIEWWHPGIAAKFFWVDALAARSGAQRLWLMIDTDVRDPTELRIPIYSAPQPDEPEPKLAVLNHRFGLRYLVDTPACERRAFVPNEPEWAGKVPTPTCTAEGIQRAAKALAEHANQANCTEQTLCALVDAVKQLNRPACVVRSSQLLQTSLGHAIVERARANPTACVRAFNHAVQQVPQVARMLAEHGPRGAELPFWTRGADGTRLRVYAEDLPSLTEMRAPLWTRAFLTSAIARAALCDRFVHGSGGAIYEQATEEFARVWLETTLPPFDTATATLRLPFPADRGPPPLTRADIRRRWFDPQASGHQLSEGKALALQTISALPRKSAPRKSAWRKMQLEIAQLREVHASSLSRDAARAHSDQARAKSAEIAADRTWACVLHPPEAISRLAAQIHELHVS